MKHMGGWTFEQYREQPLKVLRVIDEEMRAIADVSARRERQAAKDTSRISL